MHFSFLSTIKNKNVFTSWDTLGFLDKIIMIGALNFKEMTNAKCKASL